MSRTLHVAAVQMSMVKAEMSANLERASEFIAQAAGAGADVVLLPELFCDHYFCKTQEEAHFATAAPWREHAAVIAMQELARELNVVLPVSIFEKDGPEYFNSVVMIDADGSLLGLYRKSHIPDGPGYQEKF